MIGFAADIRRNRLGRRSPSRAITSVIEAEGVERSYPSESPRTAYTDIRNSFEESGFEHKLGALHVSVDEMGAIESVVLAQDLADGFEGSVPFCTDVRMLRIEDDNDVMPSRDRERRGRTKR